jgi:hypothetical protein
MWAVDPFEFPARVTDRLGAESTAGGRRLIGKRASLLHRKWQLMNGEEASFRERDLGAESATFHLSENRVSQASGDFNGIAAMLVIERLGREMAGGSPLTLLGRVRRTKCKSKCSIYRIVINLNNGWAGEPVGRPADRQLSGLRRG